MGGEATTSEMLRFALGASGDPRAVRTRTAVAEAVHRLAERGAPVSVAAIAKEAGVSRAAFYTHYAGLDELALALTRDAFLGIAALWAHDADEPGMAMRHAQRRLVDHFVAHRALLEAVAALPVSKEAYLSTVRAMSAVIEPAVAAHPDRPSELDPEPVARYIAGAAYGLIDAWLAEELSLDDDAVVEHLARMLPPWFSGLR